MASYEDGGGRFPDYVPVWKRRQKAEREVAAMVKRGHAIRPISISGRRISTTFWGQSWCTHLEKYSDYASRLPRGRSYLRNGSVVDLQITSGKVMALVMGSSLYSIDIRIEALKKPRWASVVGACAGKIDSVVEVLSGKLSTGVMEVVCNAETGLFPSGKEISLRCSCPDGARLCKHLAAVLYGIGARLDVEPGLFFVLRGVDPTDLLGCAAGLALASAPARLRALGEENLAELFGIELAVAPLPPVEVAPSPTKPKRKLASGSTQRPAKKRKKSKAR